MYVDKCLINVKCLSVNCNATFDPPCMLCDLVGKPISTSVLTMKKQQILHTYNYCKIKHETHVPFLFYLFHSTRISHSNTWPGTASKYVCLCVYISYIHPNPPFP